MSDKFLFGDKVQNTHASNDNPHKNGIFVREFIRNGKLNPGKISQITNGRGDFWEIETRHLVRSA